MTRCMGCMKEYEDGLTVCPHCGYRQGTPAREAYHLPPETILSGRYLVGRVLGFGGFGTTYIAWDLVLEKKVAIKEYMPSDFATRAPGETQLSVYDGELGEQFEAGLKSFIDESRRLAKFNHEDGIVHIFDSFLENGTAYIVMEYLEGKTLKELLKERGGKIPYEEAVGYILPILKSLDTVHQTGIIHRDIAPDNIFLTNDGKVKLIDFGASRYATTLHSKSLSVILKQGYAPEEQYRSHGEQGPWSDVYAVCATLYRAITGVVPEDALERCANDKLVPPSKMGIQLPQGIENAILNGLNTKAENRIQSAKELAQALSGEIEVQRIKEEKKKEDVGKWSKKQIIIASCSGVAVFAVIILAVLGVFNLNKSLDTTLYATVPDYIGMMLDEAQADWVSYCEAEGITNISLSVLDGVTADTITGYEVNSIYAVAPEVGSWFKKAETEQKYLYVTVVLKSVQQMIEENQGKDSWVMQNLENYSQADAQRILESMVGVNFTFETIASEKSAGTVIRTEPAAGMQINKGDTIIVYISDGSQMNVVETVDEEVVRQEEEANNGGNFFDNLFDNLRPGNDEDKNNEPSTSPESSTDSGMHPSEGRPTDPATPTDPTEPHKYTLTVSRRNGIASVTGTGQYEAGTNVTVTATVSSGYEFTGWTSSNTSLVPDSSNVSYTFRMPAANITLTASAGTDSEKIYTAQQLYNVRNNLSGNYKLMANIDLSSYSPWTPIGDGEHSFSGVFDGNGYTISGYQGTGVQNDYVMYSGLFGTCSDSAIIKNLTLNGKTSIKFKVPANENPVNIYVGGIVGRIQGGSVSNCTSNCAITVEGSDQGSNTTTCCMAVGGITGLANSYAKIMGCANIGTVMASSMSGSRTDSTAGGIVGELWNGSSAERCRNSGEVIAISSTASNKYWTSAIAGGIAGDASGTTITTSYNTGDITAVAEAENRPSRYNPFCLAGGIVGGSMNSSINISNSYNTGTTSATGTGYVSNVYACGILGHSSGGTITACYSSVIGDSTGTANLIGTGANIQSCVTKLPLGTSQSSYPGFDFTNTWIIKSGTYRYPQLRNNPHR